MIVTDCRDDGGGHHGLDVEIVPVTAASAKYGAAAYATWGRGQHSTALNFGDCFAYDVAKTNGRPLLCVGQDFGRADVECVVEGE